jgi:chloramphenicol O-acetyltransferase type A
MYDIIDIEQWKRKDLFILFKSYDNPTWDLICDVNITHFYKAIKEIDTPFFLSFLYAASSVCNSIDELRCRIDAEGQVRQYHVVHPGSTILYENETYGFGYFDFHPDFRSFITAAKGELEIQKSKQDVDPKDDDLARIYFSPIPWVSFSGFRHPFRKGGNISIPMIVFGKHFEKDGERFLPVGLTLHHGLADGYHAGLFFNKLQEKLDHPESYIGARI